MSDSVTYGSTLPSVQAYSPSAVRSVGVRRHRYSWMMALKPLEDTLGATDGGTEFRTIDIPDDFYAVRVGFMNITTSTWDVTLIKAVGSAPTSSYLVPIDEDGATLTASEWSTLTSVGAGVNNPDIVTIAGASTALTVLANATDPDTGVTDNPAWTMTDWVPCRSRGADPVTGMRRLMIRSLIPSSQNLTYNSVLTGAFWPTNASLNKGYFSYTGGARNNVDYVTDPTTGNNLTNTGNALISQGDIVAIIQVMTRKPCVQGMHTGDSTMAGTGTTGSIYTMSLIAPITLGQEFVETAPISNVCAATGGTTSAEFFPRMTTLLPIVQPTYCILPGWTSNDLGVGGLSPEEMVAHFGARIGAAADACRDNGVVPIYMTPWGWNTLVDFPDRLAAWRALRAAALAKAIPGEIVVDQFGLCGNVDTGQYDEGMDVDDLHPTTSANRRAVQVLEPAIKTVAGL